MKKKKPVTKSQRMVIPTLDEMDDPPPDLSAYRILIFGRKAVGKTSLMAQFPGLAVGMLERQRKGLKIRKVALKNWDDCREFRDACLEDETVTMVGLDTFDVLYDHCLTYECRARGIEHPGQMKDYGATWTAIKDSLNEFLDSISEAGKGIITTSHEKKDTVETRQGDPYDMLIPTCKTGAFSILQESWEICLHYGYYNRQRALSVRPLSEANTEVWCSTNVQESFLDPSGEPISLFTVPGNAKGAYEELEAAFHNQVWDAVRGKPSPKKKSRSTEDD